MSTTHAGQTGSGSETNLHIHYRVSCADLTYIHIHYRCVHTCYGLKRVMHAYAYIVRVDKTLEFIRLTRFNLYLGKKEHFVRIALKGNPFQLNENGAKCSCGMLVCVRYYLSFKIFFRLKFKFVFVRNNVILITHNFAYYLFIKFWCFERFMASSRVLLLETYDWITDGEQDAVNELLKLYDVYWPFVSKIW